MNVTKDRPAIRKQSLGKGLSSLLSDDQPDVIPYNEVPHPPLAPERVVHRSNNMILLVNPESIEPNPHQPRKVFDEQSLRDLAASIRVDGVLQPLIVSTGDKPGCFVLVAGERRLRASRLAGLEKVPVIVKEGAVNDMLRLALIENIQRSDLNIIEEAEAYASLIKDFGYTQEQCAEKVGKERSTVTNSLRLLNLPREIQDDIMEARLSMGHGRALLALPDKKMMLRARDLVVKRQLSVRETEALCKTLQLNPDRTGQTPMSVEGASAANADLNYVADTLRSQLKTKVKISGTAQRGKIEISYFTPAELERIVSLLAPQFR